MAVLEFRFADYSCHTHQLMTCTKASEDGTLISSAEELRCAILLDNAIVIN